MPGSSPAAWQRTAGAFTAAVESGRLDLPLPGSGATWERWAAFADLAGEDLSLARLGEGHADAVAILAELGGPRPRPGSRWGVWAANPPGPNVTASRQRGMLGAARHQAVLLGGAGLHACPGHGGRRRRSSGCSPSPSRNLEPREDSWPATGMAGSDTLDVGFPGVPAVAGRTAGRVHRTGRGSATAASGWRPAGTAGHAASAADAARRRGQARHRPARARAPGGRRPRAAHGAGRARARRRDEIDADPGDLRGEGPLRALRVRALTEAVATDVLARTGRALGAGPLSHDEAHSRAVADLTVYLRQHHAERDLARLGELVAEQRSRVVSRAAGRASRSTRRAQTSDTWAAWPWLSTLPGAGLDGRWPA